MHPHISSRVEIFYYPLNPQILYPVKLYADLILVLSILLAISKRAFNPISFPYDLTLSDISINENEQVVRDIAVVTR